MTTKLVYPIFLECCNYTKDNFWKYIFEDLAYGKTPYGIYIYCNHICCNYKNKEFNYKIDAVKDSKVLYNDIYNLFNKRFELLSEKDKLNRKSLFEEHTTVCDFKKNKYNIIFTFIIDMKIKWNLSVIQTNKLLSYIMLLSLFKLLTTLKMKRKKEKITAIDGIQFKKNNIIFKKNILKNLIVHSPVEIVQDKKLSTLWKKYLQKL